MRKQFIINPEVMEVINIDTGTIGTKIKNHRGEYLFIPSFSLEIRRNNFSHEEKLKEYLENEQPKGDVIIFVDQSSNERVRKNHGIMISKSVFEYEEDYNSDYNYKNHYTYRKYILEVLAYIATALYNREKKKFDKDKYEIYLNVGVTSELDLDDNFKNEIIKQFQNQTFTIETIIGFEGSREIQLNKIMKKVTFKIKQVSIFEQAEAAMYSLAYTQKGEINKKYTDLIKGKPLIIDIGYTNKNTSGFDAGYWLMQLSTTNSQYTLKSVDKKLSGIWKRYNPKFENIHEVRLFREKKLKEFTIANSNKSYLNVEQDINEIWKDNFDDFQCKIRGQWENFANFSKVVFAGGTGIIYYNKFVNIYKDRIVLAKAEQIGDDDTLAVLMAITEGYYRLFCNRMLKRGVLKSEDFIEVDVKTIF